MEFTINIDSQSAKVMNDKERLHCTDVVDTKLDYYS